MNTLLDFAIKVQGDLWILWLRLIKLSLMIERQQEINKGTPPDVLKLEGHAQAELMEAFLKEHNIPLGGKKAGVDDEAFRAGEIAGQIGTIFREVLEQDSALEKEILAEEREFHYLLPEVKERLLKELERRIELS